MAVETEIKLRLTRGVPEFAAVLERLGYHATPRQLEVDQIYDLPEGQLRASGRLLRLRARGPQWLVTYKGPATPGRHKSREEIETTVGDGPTFAAVLDGLGYRPSFRYEKYRTTWRHPSESGLVTIDETPIGVFVELEGEAEWIDATAAKLGYSEGDYITSSYASLYQDYLRTHPGVPPNMTF